MNQKTLGIVLAVIVVVGAVGYFTFVKKSNPTPTPTPITTTTDTTPQKTPAKTPPVKSGWKKFSWHDPANTILGFSFDAPSSWVETPNSERQITVMDCPQPYSKDCNQVPADKIISIDVQVISRTYSPDTNPLPTGWTKTTVNIGGIVADKVIKPGNITLTDIDFNRDGNWYHIELASGGSSEQQKENEPIFDHMLSTFAFTSAQPPQAPAEYSLFKNIDTWALTYQSNNTSALVCTDGRKGSTAKNYVFQMSTQGDTNNGTSPGDIDTPYGKVITALKNNGWQQCKTVGETELQDTQGTSEVFIKSNKLIGVFKHYSMGVGNSLWIDIQY